ncbi:DUF2272 domain-containing protein [Noviherbaspirillum sp.]|uniref:DUF2272 domain-containing protein n=1 Tax=Noviherbaspirillum sp. TaxID=1926288 RepID=UPI002FE42BEE
MRHKFGNAVRLALAAACLSHLSVSAMDAACRHDGATSPLGNRIADLAVREHREFGGHRIDANGYLVRFGAVESETELLLNPESGRRSAETPGRFAWRRVWEYWVTLNRKVPGETADRKIVFVPGLLDDPASQAPAREQALGTLLPELDKHQGAAGTALREAAVRAALNDSPWSAAFISYLMHHAGLAEQQFRYSSTHSYYITPAFESMQNYAYHACDPHRARPRVGDLLCYSRSNPPLKSFSAWQAAVRAAGFITASHCDVVVEVDIPARKFDTIGGNVMQSVTRRTLKLNEAGVLSRSHRVIETGRSSETDCSLRQKCRRQDFNRQYWGVLLRLK